MTEKAYAVPWQESSPATDRQVDGRHYKDFIVQPVEFTEKNNLSFLEGCVIKRVCRHSRGGKGEEDIHKAIHELELILELQYGVKRHDV